MNAIIKCRGGGKTHELITKYFIPTSSILIVMVERDKQRIVKEYHLSKEQADRIIPSYRFKEFTKGNNNTEPILIDNVEYLLSTVLGRIPETVTFTGEIL